jgi:hypothetical protein
MGRMMDSIPLKNLLTCPQIVRNFRLQAGCANGIPSQYG